jgi:hypothetical protein
VVSIHRRTKNEKCNLKQKYRKSNTCKTYMYQWIKSKNSRYSNITKKYCLSLVNSNNGVEKMASKNNFKKILHVFYIIKKIRIYKYITLKEANHEEG